MITDVQLGEATESAIASLRTAVNFSKAYGGSVVDGSMYSPSDRAVHRAEFVYEHGTDEQWEVFLYALEEAYETLDIVWEDGMAWRADSLPSTD